ncbi:MAG: hypothetical protein IKN32_00870 [Bacteroidales bacterium]|nr:hypothetical protein [Bacteroidales bacterium]
MPNNEFEKLTIGGNPIYARDSQARADIALLQAAYAGLTETDIIVGALPSSGTANKIYRVPGTGSYSDYMWDGTQFVLMATYTVDGLQAQVGYFVCSTAAATAAKEVTAASYVLGNGGAVKIKMDNANTANSVTLNINSQGAKTLFYEGSEASKYNSWKAGEIVVVFYDGTNYQAFNIGHDFADNIKSWSQKANDVTSAMTDTVRTTAGDESIDSDKGGVLLGISPNTEFTPSKLVSSGFNLLRLLSNNGLCKETADELAWFFPVPHLVATNDSIGTASENNGVLFTDSEGTNLTPAVRFQPIADGEPTAYTDGSAASYVTKDGRRHYVTSGIGWLIVPKTEITWATTCAHIGWSRRYDEYVSPTDANDAGTVIDLSALGTMRTVGAGGSFINDFAERTDATHMLLTTRVGRVKPTWVRGELDEETGLYTYTATVSGIVNDGIAEFEGASMPAITVNGTTLSYESEESTAKDAYVKYNLATVTTASKSVATAIANIEDWGVEAVIATSGTAVVMLQYSQGYPDAVAALVASYEKTLQVLVELIANLRADFNGMREYLNKMGEIAALSVDSTDGYTQMGQKVFDICDGAPQEYTLSTGLFRYDVTNSVLYVAKAIAKDNSGWAIV